MKKWISILLALALCLPFSACGQEASSAPESGPSDRSNGAGPLSEEEAAALRDTGTLQADPLTGYDYSDATGIWYYSNYQPDFLYVTVDRDWCDNVEDAPFEDTQLMIPKGWHEVLTLLYGDYMQLPPEEQRVPAHSSMEIEVFD